MQALKYNYAVSSIRGGVHTISNRRNSFIVKSTEKSDFIAKIIKI